ncbi:hypothetical protein BH10PSE14_BH10PSE14_15490 [soil metagenome]
MIMLAFLMASVPVASDRRLSFQLMVSPAYQAFARKADLQCLSQKLRYLHPGELGQMEEGFGLTLSTRDRRRLAAVDEGFKDCPPAGMSCPAQHRLGAIAKLGMLDTFTRYACSTAG